MKNLIIEELILNNTEFIEKIQPNKAYETANACCDKVYKQLKEMLNDKQFELVDKLVDSHFDLEYESNMQYLLYGFKTGIMLVAECLNCD